MTSSIQCEATSATFPSELFAARARSHKIPVRGQKDFFPNDSDEQRERLEQSLHEHWSLISEERVERLGSLVKATWVPSDQIVELQSPAGKFWQTMGFSDNGKQYLLPEEALYLMECGNLQVFYQDLPLSIQDGYERFLSSNTVSLQQYQVFGHLKRLGYVVHRFDPSHTDAQDASTTERMEEDERSHEGEEDKTLPESHVMTSPEASEAQTAATSPADKCEGRTWWVTDVGGDSGHQADHHAASASARWDFSSILFPDLGSGERLSSCLASPDSSLLPGTLAVGDCDVAPWRQRINLREVKMSAKEREQDKHRRHWDVNKDKEVRQCRNWAEYRDLLARRERKRKGQQAHLWNSEVAPLHDPRQQIPTGELLDKISVIKSTHLLEGASSASDAGSSEKSQFVGVFPSGLVLADSRQVLTSTCQLNLFRFPFDEQSCNITFSSMNSEEKTINLGTFNNDTILTKYSEMIMITQGEWQLTNMEVEQYTHTQGRLVYMVKITRKPVLYVIILILPLFYLLVLDLASFFIHEARGEKLSFKVTVLLSISVLLLILQDMLPSTEDRLPLIATYCVTTFTLVGVSVLEAMLVSFLIDLEGPCGKTAQSSVDAHVDIQMEADHQKGQVSSTMAGGITDTGEPYSAFVGLVYMFNLIVGTGALTMPKAFASAGWVVSIALISFLGFMSYMTTTFMIEAMAAANAQLRWKRREQEEIDDSDSTSEYSDDDVMGRGRSEPETKPILSVQRSGGHVDHFDIVERVEMGQMASMFFNKVGVNMFYICIIVYLYGDLAIYAAAVPISLMEVACGNHSCSAGSVKYNDTDPCWGSVTRKDAYRVFLLCCALRKELSKPCPTQDPPGLLCLRFEQIRKDKMPFFPPQY
eukprot:superscaffoldBa00003959_g18023